MLSIKDLQAKVNEIAKNLDGLDTNEKLAQAKAMARQDPEVQGILLEILDEALTKRWNRDMHSSIKRFLSKAA